MWATKLFKKYAHKKSVLYAVTILCAVFLIGMLAASQVHIVVLFTLIAFVTSFFTRNMSIILSAALLSTLAVYLANRARKRRWYEGLENADADEKKAQLSDAKDSAEMDGTMDEQISDGIAALKETKNVEKAKASLKEKRNKQKGTRVPDETDAVPSAESFRPNESKFTEQKGSRIDYAATLEDSYNYLDKILSSDGVGKLTTDTQKLMHQQQNLFNTMTNMTGMLKNTKDMMKTLNVDGLSSLAASAVPESK